MVMFAVGVIDSGPYADAVTDPVVESAVWASVQRCADWRQAANGQLDAQASSILALGARCSYVAQGQTGVALLIGGSTDVTVLWPAPGFPTGQYAVDILPMQLVGKATAEVVSQNELGVTVRVTAVLALALGTQFLVFGRN